MKKRSLISLICTAIILVCFIFSLVLFFIVKEEHTNKLLVLVILMALCSVFSVLNFLFLFFDEKNRISKHVIESYEFLPIVKDHVHEIRALMYEEPLENSEKEKERMEKCILKVNEWDRKNNAYLIKKNDTPYGVLLLSSRSKNKPVEFEILFAKEEVDLSIIEKLYEEEHFILKK